MTDETNNLLNETESESKQQNTNHLKFIIHPSIHCSMGSAPVGAQCPLTSSLGEFLGYWDWLWYPGLSSVLVSIALPFALDHVTAGGYYGRRCSSLSFWRITLSGGDVSWIDFEKFRC